MADYTPVDYAIHELGLAQDLLKGVSRAESRVVHARDLLCQMREGERTREATLTKIRSVWNQWVEARDAATIARQAMAHVALADPDFVNGDPEEVDYRTATREGYVMARAVAIEAWAAYKAARMETGIGNQFMTDRDA